MAHSPRARSLTRLTTLLAAATLAACSSAPAAETEQDLVARARAIHDRVVTMDTHVDINADHFLPEGENYVTGVERTQVDLPSMEEGGLDAVWFSIYQGQQQDFTPEGYARAHGIAMAKIEAIHRLTSELAPDRIGLALTAEDVRRISAEGRKVALMGMENGYAIGEDVSNVRRFSELGVRYLSLAHNGNNQLSDSNNLQPDGERHGGLSPLGREVVAEANRWGIVLDISHPSKAANLQTMELSRAPVMASHSSVRALGDHSRNLDDEELRALQRNGGVVQIVAFASYLNVPPPERTAGLAALRGEFELTGPEQAALAALPAERRAEYDARRAEIDAQWPAPPRATVSDLVDHIDYAVRLIGIDHVGISSDFDGGGGVEGWNDATETFNVTLELVRRGYTEEEIEKLWSGNVLRVMEEVERVAAQSQAGG
jgi:membrane dipeptidase